MKVLVVNVGSTSLKFRLYAMENETVEAVGKIERVGSERSPYNFQVTGRSPITGECRCDDQHAAIDQALQMLTDADTGVLGSLADLDAVGFKPVHAKAIAAPVLVSDDVIRAMQQYVPLAPAHNPPYISAFRIFKELLPDKPLVGVFEPAFHTSIPDAARTYGIPYEWTEKHAIRRYGFHGASHRFISERVPQLLNRPTESLRIISCHLGGSSSICAIDGGRSVDTSMGFSPQSGLPNATRCGDLDPFILLYVMQQEGLTVDQMCDRLTTDGGLAGISGTSGDVRDLEEAADLGNARARLALDVLVHETKKYIGAYLAVLGGADALAFTGGIGENGVRLRASICTGLDALGIRLNNSRNDVRSQEATISDDDSPVTVMVIPANEELIIARETVRLLSNK